jgi:predicted MFS family arabinose efflux permease
LFYGLGFTLFYYPILSMVNDFWIQRRGFAYGILCSASGLSGCVIPFAMEAALNRWGYRVTLRAAAGGLAVVTGPLLLFLRGRMENERSISSTQPRTDWGFLKAGQFWVYSLSNLVQGIGYFFPGLYLPSYANSIGLSSRQGALLLAIMGTAQVAGQMSFGYLSDKKVSLNLLITVSTAMSSIAVLACWGMARQYAVLIVFAIVYGFFGAGYTAMWARMGTAVSSDPTAAFAAFGLLNLGKGVGNVVAGPVGGSLLGTAVDKTKFGIGKFEEVVLFAGGCMVISGLTLGLGYMKRIRHVCKILMEIWSKRRYF